MRTKYFRGDIVEIINQSKNFIEIGSCYYVTDVTNECVFMKVFQGNNPMITDIGIGKNSVRLYKRPLKNWIKSLFR